jgi:hypothetical protein
MIIDDIDFSVDVSIEITTALHKILAGHPPGVQSSAIMQLFARLVAAYPPRAREPLIKLFVREGRRLVPLIEHEMFGDAGHPDKSR